MTESTHAPPPAGLDVIAPEALWRTLDLFRSETGRRSRYVGCYWTALGDELCVSDGLTETCGMSDNWVWLEFVQDKRNLAALRPYHLGNSEEEARHELVFDLDLRRVHGCERTEAERRLRAQHRP